MTFSVKSNHTTPTTWILLDNQATADVFGNADLLDDIHEVTTPLHIHGITGVLMITQQGILPGHGTVWYHPHVSVNILSMAKLIQQYHITYDSSKENAFIVREHNNTQIKYIFQESHDGLYYHDVSFTQQIYITTVTENKQKYSQSDVKRADGVRALQKIIGHPTARHLSYLLIDVVVLVPHVGKAIPVLISLLLFVIIDVCVVPRVGIHSSILAKASKIFSG